MANQCNCPSCKFDSHVRGVIRRGDKKEMRAMIRDLSDMVDGMEEELEEAQNFIHHLTHDHEDVSEKKIFIN